MPADKDQLHALLADYVEGSLSEQQIEEAEAYLAANPGVRSVVDKLMVDSEALRALPPVRSPVDYSEEIRQTAERDLLLSDAPVDRQRPLSGPTLALAAMLFVTLGLGGAAYWILTHRPATNFDFASTVGAPPAATQPVAEEKAKPTLTNAATFDKDAPALADATREIDAVPHADAAPHVGAARHADAALRGDAASLAAAASPLAVPPAAPVAPQGEADPDPAPLAMRRERAAPAAIPPGGEPANVASDEARVVAAPAPHDAAFAGGGGGWPRELEIPAAVQAVVDAAPVEGGRPALAVVVNDVAAVDAVRKLVRDNVGLEQQAQNVYERVSNANVLAATLPVDLGPLVATDVPAALANRIRAAVATSHAASVYDVAPARANAADAAEPSTRGKQSDVAAPATPRAEAAPQQVAAQQQQQQQQQLSGVPAAKAMPASRPTNVDVFVIVVPAPATVPAE